MSTSAPTAEAIAAEHRLMLRELAELGMRMARELPEQASAENADHQGLSLAYSRVSRAIRLTLVLEARSLIEAKPAARTVVPLWEQQGITQEAWSARMRTDSNRHQVHTLVETAIEHERSDRERERLTEALYERMDDERDEEAFASGAPVAQVVSAICRDLGLTPNWRHFDDDDWEPISDATKIQLLIGKYAEATGAHSTPPPAVSAPHPFMETG